MELFLASNNEHKVKEMEQILSGHRILTPRQVGVEFYHEETGSSFHENALGKAMTLFRLTGKPVIADDSGLSVTALGGAPGIYSARFGDGPDGTVLTTEQRNSYLLEKLQGIEERQAFFLCCMVLVLHEERIYSVQETFPGIIATRPSGMEGFGYDPLFYLPEYGKTVAQLPEDEKNRISHRGRAGRAMAALLDHISREVAAPAPGSPRT